MANCRKRASRVGSCRFGQIGSGAARKARSGGVPRPCTDPRAVGGRVDRYYDPSTDQFLSVDPDVAETSQPYAFTGDDPLNATDPLGLKGKLPPCSTPSGGVQHFRGRVGDLEIEQEPYSGKVRIGLRINSVGQRLLDPVVTVSGSIKSYTPTGKVRLDSDYGDHTRPPSYYFHSSLANVPVDSTVTVQLNGDTGRQDVKGFTVFQQCTTVVGPEVGSPYG